MGQSDLFMLPKLAAVSSAHHPGAGLVFSKHCLHGISDLTNGASVKRSKQCDKLFSTIFFFFVHNAFVDFPSMHFKTFNKWLQQLAFTAIHFSLCLYVWVYFCMVWSHFPTILLPHRVKKPWTNQLTLAQFIKQRSEDKLIICAKWPVYYIVTGQIYVLMV